MGNIGITRVSSKGQIVIPQDMRGNLNEGDKLLIIQKKGSLILKRATDLDETFKEDLEFARRTEQAIKRIESGKFIKVDSENLFEEISKW